MVEDGVFGICGENIEEPAGEPAVDNDAVEAVDGTPVEAILALDPMRARLRDECDPEGGRLATRFEVSQRAEKS